MRGLHALNRPLAALDSLAWADGVPRLRARIARLPGAEAVRRWYPPETRIPALPEDVMRLRPVPVAPPQAADGAFRLYCTPPRVARDRVLAVRAAYGVGRGELLVVFPRSAWASKAFDHMARANGSHGDHRRLFRAWLARVLGRLGRPITVVGVGSAPARAEPLHAQVRFADSPLLPLQGFTELLAAADLFLTDNITSCAMARAVLVGTPAVALLHSGNVPPQEPADQVVLDGLSAHLPGVLFTYSVFPYGWCEELSPLLTGNPFLDAVPRAPAYRAAAAARCIEEVLATAAAGHVPGRDELLASMARLPDGAQAVTAWLAPPRRPTPQEHA